LRIENYDAAGELKRGKEKKEIIEEVDTDYADNTDNRVNLKITEFKNSCSSV
jgi:hypothetical protein